MTTWLTVGFFAISFGLAYFAKERAAGIDELGIPIIEESVSIDALPEGLDDAASDAGLTTPAEPVDSEIPDL